MRSPVSRARTSQALHAYFTECLTTVCALLKAYGWHEQALTFKGRPGAVKHRPYLTWCHRERPGEQMIVMASGRWRHLGGTPVRILGKGRETDLAEYIRSLEQ